MKGYFKKITVTPSDIDFQCKMNVTRMMEKFQEIAGDHVKLFNADNETLIKNYNVCWFITRMKMDIKHFPHLGDDIIIETFPTEPKRLKQNRLYVIYNSKNEVLVNSISEWCLYDMNLKRLKRFDELKSYFMDSLQSDTSYDGCAYTKFNMDVLDEDFCYEYESRACDIDMNLHTNNVSYGRMIINSFNCDYLNKNKLKSFEIKFINQSFEGDIIRIFKKYINEDSFYIVGKAKENDSKIFESMVKF